MTTLSINRRTISLLFAAAALFSLILVPHVAKADLTPGSTPGELQIIGPDQKPAGFCPLQHTDVAASVAGYVARVTVRQIFHNPSTSKIEAVYVFPLPQDSAVDAMSMVVGTHKIEGTIKPKAEARQIYNEARQAGETASLLDQERPNIFSQYVANIEPGGDVSIQISYTEMLKYDAGVYEFVFPMVVGPRYNGGSAVTGHVPVTDHISPPVTPEGTRSGHDIGISVVIDAGAPMADIGSISHQISVTQQEPDKATVTLKNMNEIPNKDFVLRYRTTTDNVSEAFLTNSDPTGHYFTLVVQPPHRAAAAQIVPKEMIFVIDQTGSQSGLPIDKAKDCVRYCLKNLNRGDTFQVLAFNTSVFPCFKGPAAVSAENVQKALDFINPLQGNGGTDILQACDYVFKIPTDPKRLRVISYMTDGYVGNDMAIIAFIKAHRGSATMFPFGTGSSVNRYLIDGMALAGGGEPEYVDLNADSRKIADEFYARVHNPVLTHITVSFSGVSVSEIYPRSIPDLFSEKPIMIHGRLDDLAAGTCTITGETADGPYSRTIALSPADADSHPALPSLWARAKIADITLNDIQNEGGAPGDDAVTEITELGVDYHLMTQYTSFVAVDTSRKVKGPDGGTVDTPVEMPDGVSYQGVFGEPQPIVNGPISSISSGATGGFVAGTPFASMKGGVPSQIVVITEQNALLVRGTSSGVATRSVTHSANGNYSDALTIPQPATETGFFGANGDAYSQAPAEYHVTFKPAVKIASAEICEGDSIWREMIYDTATNTWLGSTYTGSVASIRVTTRSGATYTVKFGSAQDAKSGLLRLGLTDAHSYSSADVRLPNGRIVALVRGKDGQFNGSAALPKSPDKPVAITFTLKSAGGAITTITMEPRGGWG